MGAVRERVYKGEVVHFIDFIAANGQRVRQTIGAGEKNKRLAKKVLAQREAETKLGIYNLPATQTMRFDECAADWLNRMRPPRVRSKTWEGYEDAVERLLPYFGGRRLGSITREDVDAYLVSGQMARPHHQKQRARPKPLSVTTLNYTLSILRFILGDAVERGHISSNSASRATPLPKTQPRVQYLTPAQRDALLAVAPDPWKTMYHLMIDAGLRRGEALALRGQDIDFANRRLYVRQSRIREREGNHYVVRDGPPKTKTSMTVIDELSPSVVDALLALAGDRSERDYVFRNHDGGPLDPDHADRVFRRHIKTAGIPPTGFHTLRHTCATLLIAAGENIKAVQTRMRHASAQTTLDTYATLLPTAFEGMGARVDAWLEGNRKANNPAPRENASPPKSLEPASHKALKVVGPPGFEPGTS